MNDQDISERIAAILALPRAEMDQTEVRAIVRDAVRPLAIGTAGEIATLAGTNYRDRQSLKRKASRWTKMFAAMPSLEQLLMLRAIADAALPDEG